MNTVRVAAGNGGSPTLVDVRINSVKVVADELGDTHATPASFVTLAALARCRGGSRSRRRVWVLAAARGSLSWRLVQVRSSARHRFSSSATRSRRAGAAGVDVALPERCDLGSMSLVFLEMRFAATDIRNTMQRYMIRRIIGGIL